MFKRSKWALAILATLLVGPAAAEVYNIDSEHSSVAFSIRHLVSRTSGNFHEFTGTINYDATAPEKTAVEAIIQVASIDTDNIKRDAHLRSGDFFDAEQFPTITFKSTHVALKGETLELTGEFTMHGVTSTITFPVEILGTGTHPYSQKPIVGFDAQTVIKRSDYGVNNWTDAAGILGDEVKVHVTIEAIAGE